MAIMKTVTAAQKLINETLKKRDKESESALDLIRQAEKNIQEIDSRVEEAAKEGNPLEYKKAKQELEDARDIKEMYERRYNAFIEKPQISEEDYKRIISEIMAEYDILQLNAKDSLAKLAEEMKAISDHLRDAATEANDALRHLQHDLFMDGDRMRAKNGTLCNPADEKRIRDYSAIRWGQVAVESLIYSNYIRNRESNEQ